MRYAILLLVLAGHCLGATYYVDATGGSDVANGTTTGTAWKTLGKVQGATFVSGDTVRLKCGETWLESLQMAAGQHDGIILDSYGTGVAPIIDGGGLDRRFAIFCDTATGTITRNLNLRNCGGVAPTDTGAIWEGAGSGTSTIEDCTVDLHNSDACIGVGGTGTIIVRRCAISRSFDDGITLHGATTAVVENCTVTQCTQGINNSGSGSHMTMTVSDSAFINNGDGMGGGGALDGLDDCTAIFNRCILATGAKGALMRPNSAGSTTFNYCSFDTSAADSVSGPYINGGNCAVTFNNCTLYGGTAVNGYLLLSTGGTIAMHNCIVDHWWKEEGTGGSYTKDHCLTNAAGSVVDVTSTNALTGDPLFVEPSAGNFRLLTGSPAINAGTDLGLGADLAGHAVANPPEVGAYEFGPFTGATIGNMNAAALTVTP